MDADERLLLERCDTPANRQFGISNDEMEQVLAHLSPERRMQVLNSLLVKHRLEILKRGEQLSYRAVSTEEAGKFKGLTADDIFIYQLVKEKGTEGIWTKDMKRASNLQQTQINKTLKTLESRKLIKPFKSVLTKNRKFYILYEIEPSTDHTGGPWYCDGEIDLEFISVLSNQACQFVHSKGPQGASVREILNFLVSSGISKVLLTQDHIQSLVDCLIYDNKLDQKDTLRGEVHYRCTGFDAQEALSAAYTSIPCVTCPVVNFCSDEGDITPSNCEYYTRWLAF